MNRTKSQEILIYTHLVLSFTVFPLFFTNYYYNIQLSKSLFFLFLSVALFAALVIVSPFPTRRIIKTTLSPRSFSGYLWAILFFFSLLISSCLSESGLSCFTGAEGRYIGTFLLTAMLLTFFVYALHPVDLRPVHFSIILGGSIVGLLGILQFYRIDPLGLSIHVPAKYTGMYLSTIGQINTFSGYIALFLSFTIASYCRSGSHLLLLPSLIGYVSLLIGNSDSGFFSVFTAILLIPFGFSDQKSIYRLFEQIILFAFCALIAGALTPNGLIPYQGFSAVFSDFQIALPLLTVFSLIRLWLPSFKSHSCRASSAAIINRKRIYLLILAVALSALILAIFLTNLGIVTCSPLLFCDEWGSFRGFIWKKLLEIYVTFPLSNQLFGYGPDTLKPLLLSLCREEMLSVTGMVYDSAHNDFLHYLITTGAFGAFSWLFFWISVFIRTWRSPYGSRLPWAAALTAYLVQALLIPTQPITAPLGFLIAGICVSTPNADSPNPT